MNSYFFHVLTEKPEPKFFSGMSAEFDANSKQYVLGWNAMVTQEEAQTRCKSIGATLARLFSGAKLEEVV